MFAAETVQVDFTLAIGEGRLDASIAVPAGEVTLTQMLPVLQNLSSRIIDSTVEIIGTEGFQVSCRAGCGACCRQLVPLSIFEAEALAAWVDTLPEDRRQELAARFHSALSALRDAGLLSRLGPATHSDAAASLTLAMDYHRAGVACPFLEEESCSIHPIRPLICREYLVTSPPEFCQDPSTNQVAGVPIPIKLSKTLMALGARLENNATGWIPLVFLFAWMRGNAHPGNAIKGVGPEMLQGFLQRLTTT